MATTTRWFSKYWGGGVILIAAIGVYWANQSYAKMDQRAKYTVGYITGWHFAIKNGKNYEFRFSVDDSIYRSSSLSDKGMATANGSRFVVKYDSLHPATSVGYFNLRIPDSIRRAPANGWRVPPFPVPAWFLDHGKQN